MIKFILISFAILFFGVPDTSRGQEAIQSTREAAGATTRTTDSDGASAGAAVAVPAATTATTPIPTPTPTPILTPTPTPTLPIPPEPSSDAESSPDSVVDPRSADRDILDLPTESNNSGQIGTTPTPISTIPPPQNDASQNAENNNEILYTILAAFGLAGLVYGALKFFKQNTKQKNNNGNEKENQKCDSIKKLLDQKIKEMEESVKNWPKEKIEKTIKEYAVNRLLNEQEKELLRQAKVAKEKYDKLKETIDLLRGKYDLCKLELTSKKSKNAIIIHGWGGSPNSDWLPWLKRELENKNFRVTVPKMPETENPQIDKWVARLAKMTHQIDKNTFFVGHSIGCQAILRYLETLENKKIDRVFLVAGWLNLANLGTDEIPIAEPWLKKPMNFSKIKNVIKHKVVVFLSDNDPYNCLEENKKTFQNKLGAKIILLKNKGHFTKEDGFGPFPELLGAILK